MDLLQDVCFTSRKKSKSARKKIIQRKSKELNVFVKSSIPPDTLYEVLKCVAAKNGFQLCEAVDIGY